MRIRPLVVVAVVALGLAAPLPAVAQQPGIGGCGMAGTWQGATGEQSFLAIYADTTGSQVGTADLDLWGGDVTFGGKLPAVRMTSGRGTWRRVGPLAFDYQFLAVALGADGAVVYQLKVAGRKQMTRDCGSVTFTTTIALYAPAQDPFGDELPVIAGPFPGAPGTATRLPYPGR